MPGECLFFVHLCFTCKSYLYLKKKKKNQFYNKVKPNIQNSTHLKKLQCLQNKLNVLIDTAK